MASFASFESAFWGRPDTQGANAKGSKEDDCVGFNRILDRLRFGRKQTADLLDFFSLRLQAATEQHRRLARMCKTRLASEWQVAKDRTGLRQPMGKDDVELILADEPCCMAVAMQALVLQVADEADFQAKMIEALRCIVKTLKDSLADQERIKHKHKVNVKDAAAKKQGHKEKVFRARDVAYKRCKEKDAVTAMNAEGLSAREVDRLEEKLRRAKEAAGVADLEYRHQVDRTNEAYTRWHDDMRASLRALQDLEADRLNCLADALNRYCGEAAAVHQAIRDSVECLQAHRVSVLNTEAEVQLFVDRRRTGDALPQPPTYVSYYGEESMVRLGSLNVRGSVTAAVAAPRPAYTRRDSTLTAPPSHSSSSEKGGLAAHRASTSSVGGGRTTPPLATASEPASPPPTPRLKALLGSAVGKALFTSTFPAEKSKHRPPFRCTALYDYDARAPDELSFREGDIVSATDTSDDPWWFGSVVGAGGGAKGSFPSNFVSVD